jgi:hypothetical protein
VQSRRRINVEFGRFVRHFTGTDGLAVGVTRTWRNGQAGNFGMAGSSISLVANTERTNSRDGYRHREFDTRDWARDHVGLHFIPPGSLAQWLRRIVQLAYIRDECFNINIFWSLVQARVVIGDWKRDYNHHRRHSSLGYLPPARTLRPALTDERGSPAVGERLLGRVLRSHLGRIILARQCFGPSDRPQDERDRDDPVQQNVARMPADHRTSPLLALTVNGHDVLEAITERAAVANTRLAAALGPATLRATRDGIRRLILDLKG